MRKFISMLILFASLVAPLTAADNLDENYFQENYDCFDPCCLEWSVAAKTAVFFPLDSKVRRIYGDALPAFTVEGNLKFTDGCYGAWGIWLDTSYVFGSGHSYGFGRHSTHLNLIPITLGLKYIHHLSNCFDVYLGVGPSYSVLNTRDHSPFVHFNTWASEAGAMVKSGFIYNYTDCVYVEGFCNYNYQHFYFPRSQSDPYVERNSADLSSVQIGAGVGINF